ncbi:MAG: EAL domain-containing protein [Acidobacteriota bacterium]
MTSNFNRTWRLEGQLEGGQSWLIAVKASPFLIGRSPDNHLCVESSAVSRRHAELHLEGRRIALRDLGSSNGTWVNGVRIEGRKMLSAGDVIFFGDALFRLVLLEESDRSPDAEDTGIFSGTRLPPDPETLSLKLRAMVRKRAVISRVQPIFRLEDGLTEGVELTGRGDYAGLPQHPEDLFRLADRAGMTGSLTRLFWREGIPMASRRAAGGSLFINLHPVELSDPTLGDLLFEMRSLAGKTPLVVEVHEQCVTQVKQMRALRETLDDLGIRMAYDGFGSGHSRFLELIEVPPDFIKFERALLRNIHKKTSRFHKVVETLTTLARDLGIISVAEGVELKEEAEACHEIGFTHVQGYFYGRPSELPRMGA